VCEVAVREQKGYPPPKTDRKRGIRVKKYKVVDGTKAKFTNIEIEELWISSNEKCNICETDLDLSTRRFDHCHETGEFRGWLCNTCNTGLGMLGDNEAGLLRALEYLRRDLTAH
jgi:hypothetical protein